MSFAPTHRTFCLRALDGFRTAIEEHARARLTAHYGADAPRRVRKAFGKDWEAHKQKLAKRKPDYDGFELDHNQFHQLFSHYWHELLPNPGDPNKQKWLKQQLQHRLTSIYAHRNDVFHAATEDVQPQTVLSLLSEVKVALQIIGLDERARDVDQVMSEHHEFWAAQSAAASSALPGAEPALAPPESADSSDADQRSGATGCVIGLTVLGLAIWGLMATGLLPTPDELELWASATQATGQASSTQSNNESPTFPAQPRRRKPVEVLVDVPTSWCPQVPSFSLDEREVSVASFQRCAVDGICPQKPAALTFGSLREHQLQRYRHMCNGARSPARPDHPVNCVTWRDAAAFCVWAGKRLPTREEWACVLRQGRDGIPPWQAQPVRFGNVCDESGAKERTCENPFAGRDGFADTAPTDSFRKTGPFFGLVGNVSEWLALKHCTPERCASLKHHRAGASFRTGHSLQDQLGVSWSLEVGPAVASPEVGFRCARSR